MFVEVLDFNQGRGPVPLSGAPEGVDLPSDAERVAELDGVHVVYVALDSAATNRVRRAEVSEAARLIAGDLGDDLLLVFTDRDVSQLQLVLPDLTGSRPTLRRMVVETVSAATHGSGADRQDLQGPGGRPERTRRPCRSLRCRTRHQALLRGVQAGLRASGCRASPGSQPSEDEERRLFVQTLFNRLMFVYFLQRKGWIEFGAKTRTTSERAVGRLQTKPP